MMLNIAIIVIVIILLIWGVYDLYKDSINDWQYFEPPVNDTNQTRLDAIRSAEEFRKYAKSSGYREAYNLTGQAIASLYKPEELPNDE